MTSDLSRSDPPRSAAVPKNGSPFQVASIITDVSSIATDSVFSSSDEESVCAKPDVPYCACCYRIEDFPGVSFDEAFSGPEGEQEAKPQLKTPAAATDR